VMMEHGNYQELMQEKYHMIQTNELKET
jgi:hypothetical protein